MGIQGDMSSSFISKATHFLSREVIISLSLFFLRHLVHIQVFQWKVSVSHQTHLSAAFERRC